MVEANKHRDNSYNECPTCKQLFVGPLQFALSQARVQRTPRDLAALNDLAIALAEKGRFSEALAIFEKAVSIAEHSPDNLSTAYHK